MNHLLRLNRYLAQTTGLSRRKADELIAQGRVSLQGEVVEELGTKVNPRNAQVEVDGVPVDRPTSKLFYILLHKPRGVVTTLSDPEGRPTVREMISIKEKLFPVGRLDYDAEGLLLMTNDGDFAQKIAHPKYEQPRRYLVKVKGKPTPETVQRIRKGMKLEDGYVQPKEIAFERATKEHSWYRMTVTEGRSHLIKRIWLRVRHPVIKLVRTGFGTLELGDLPRGAWRMLTTQEIRKLKPKENSHLKSARR